MASSSRPPEQSGEADARENWVPGKSGKYDVFLSHRGPDTKAGFTAHLHEKLKLAGLEAYFDCRDIEKGEDTWESLERAITNSRFGLVIFSENFAGSKWCLKELHLMLHLMQTTSIRVLPIFYKVKPGYIGRSLSQARLEELQKRGCSMEDIELWRNDLKIAASRDGWEYERNDKRLEPEFLTSIVEEVSNLINKAVVRDGASEQGPVGVDHVAEQIIQNLGVKKVSMLGLWGMGGIGKTTLAWEIYSRLRKQEYYSASCCLTDVSEKVRQIGGVERVQEDILKGLCKGVGGKKIQHEIDGRNMLEGRLCNKSRFLLLLDDVSNEKDMMKYIITSKMLEGGSMCIVTTRDRGVLEAFERGCDNVHIHEVGELSSEDSTRAFACYAFGGDGQVKPGFGTLVEGMSKVCGGVPLVLKVIGSLLNGNDNLEAWQEILGSGNICKDHWDVYDRLQTSYKWLSPDQQEIFLDIACGLIGQRADLAYRVWRSSNLIPNSDVQVLVKRALVSLDDGDRFVMHDVLRDMGRTIEMRKRLEERARYWMPESLTMLKEKGLPKHLQTLVINCPDSGDMQTLDVLHMKELRILMCDGYVKVTSIPTNLRWWSSSPCLYHSKWKMFKLRHYKNITFPKIPQESKLVVLDVSWLPKCPLLCKLGLLPPCTVQVLGGLTALECLRLCHYEIDELPNLQRLNKLEEMNITYSMIKAVPGLDRLNKLEELVMSYSMIKAVPGLGHLSALVKFEAPGCRKLVELPDIGTLTRLQVLHLSPMTKTIPGLSKIMPYLTKLEVSAEGLETPDVLNAMKLLTLSVWGWSERGPRAGINSMTLKSLTIHGFGSWTKKLDGLLELKNLESIHLRYCPFEDVSCLNHLTALKSICIRSCGSLEILPDLLGLTRLETLCIHNCKRLREWALLSKSRLLSGPTFPSLQTLDFDKVVMKELPENLKVMFPRLKTMHLKTYAGLGNQ